MISRRQSVSTLKELKYRQKAQLSASIRSSKKSSGSKSAPIKVYCRFRKALAGEDLVSKKIYFNGPKCVVIQTRLLTQEFRLKGLFSPNTTQRSVYKEIGMKCLNTMVKGYNTCIMAYGNTGSGKTYTMFGSEKDRTKRGLIPRIVEGLFDIINNNEDEGKSYRVRVSYLEVYLEKVYDLLTKRKNGKKQSNLKKFKKTKNRILKIKEDAKKKTFFVSGLNKILCKNANDVLSLMKEGNHKKTQSASAFNRESSRSHSIFEIHLIQKDLNKNKEIKSSMKLIDLAGSEKNDAMSSEPKSYTRPTKSTSSRRRKSIIKKKSLRKFNGDRTCETKSINKSLSVLGKVIQSIGKANSNNLTRHSVSGMNGTGSSFMGKSVHIPYRESKLTKIIKDSLGGNSMSFIVLTCSKVDSSMEANLSTLRFGESCKLVSNTVKRNMRIKESGETKKLKEEAMRLRYEMELIKQRENKLMGKVSELNGLIEKQNAIIEKQDVIIENKNLELEEMMEIEMTSSNNINSDNGENRNDSILESSARMKDSEEEEEDILYDIDKETEKEDYSTMYFEEEIMKLQRKLKRKEGLIDGLKERLTDFKRERLEDLHKSMNELLKRAKTGKKKEENNHMNGKVSTSTAPVSNNSMENVEKEDMDEEPISCGWLTIYSKKYDDEDDEALSLMNNRKWYHVVGDELSLYDDISQLNPEKSINLSNLSVLEDEENDLVICLKSKKGNDEDWNLKFDDMDQRDSFIYNIQL